MTPAFAVCCAFSGAVALGVVMLPGEPLAAMLAALLAFASAALLVAVRPLAVAVAVVAACLGLLRAELPISDPALAARARSHAGEQVVAEGVIADDPRPRARGYEALLEPEQVISEKGRLPPLGDLLIRVRGPGEVAYGDRVSVGGKLALPVDQPGFDRRAYLAQRHAYLELATTQVSTIQQGSGVARLPGWLRSRYREAVSGRLPAPHAAVLMGIVLGIKAGIPSRLQQDLIATGLVHLLVLSGLKVAVFARLVTGILAPVLGRFATWPALALIGLYALTGGATPAAVRAAAMGGLALFARRLGRPTHVWTSLAVVCAGMLAWRPELAWDVGFQLSFAGTAAIILLTPPIERRLAWVPGFLREPFAVTCAAQIGTVPLMGTDFHLLSPIAPIANMAVLPALPVMVLLGLALAPLAAVPTAGSLLALPLAGLLAYLEQVAGLLARVPAAAIPIPAFPAWAGPAYYAALAGLISAAHAQGRRRIVALTLAVAAPLVIAAGELVLSGAGGPSVAILDVGDGQAVLLNGPGGAVLIDGGGSAARLEGELGQRLPPWQRELEALVLTAPGAGHVGGLPGFGREVREVLLPSTAFPGSAWRTIALSEAARGASVRRAHAGDVLELAGLRLEVLAPEVTDSGDDVGAGYLALRVVGPKHSFCDLSDLDAQAQMVAATHLKGGCDYLLLPAGGKSLPAPELMAIANPGQLVASRGSGRLARGLPASTLRTDQEGTIVLDL